MLTCHSRRPGDVFPILNIPNRPPALSQTRGVLTAGMAWWVKKRVTMALVGRLGSAT